MQCTWCEAIHLCSGFSALIAEFDIGDMIPVVVVSAMLDGHTGHFKVFCAIEIYHQLHCDFSLSICWPHTQNRTVHFLSNPN